MALDTEINPVMSIIIPAHNRNAQLAVALEEIKADIGDRSVEIIVVDDGSDPPVPLFGASSRIRTFRLPSRQGANAARRYGLSQARGDYINFHDSDDGVVSGWTASVLHALRIDPDIDVFVTRRVLQSSSGASTAAQSFFERNVAHVDRVRRALYLRNVLGPFGGVIFHRRVLREEMFLNIASSQDWAVFVQVFRQTLCIGSIPSAMFVHRLEGDDRISASPRRKVLGMLGLLKLWRSHPFYKILKIHHLHYFRRWIYKLEKPSMQEMMRRTRIRRRIVHGLATAYLTLILRRW